MKKVRIITYEGPRVRVERSIQYRNVKNELKLADGLTMTEHMVPDTHVIVELDREVVRNLVTMVRSRPGDEELAKSLQRVIDGVYGGDVRI